MNQELKALIQDHFKPIFDAYDKDKNTTLEKEQLRHLLADNLGMQPASISNDQLDWHFSRIDQDGDGKITFQQYFHHFFGDRAKKAMKDNKGNNDEDQLIDRQQFRKLMQDTFKPLNIPITQEMVNWNFDQIDKDGSNRISFKEYLNFIRKYN